jgi:hypothetical protein
MPRFNLRLDHHDTTTIATPIIVDNVILTNNGTNQSSSETTTSSNRKSVQTPTSRYYIEFNSNNTNDDPSLETTEVDDYVNTTTDSYSSSSSSNSSSSGGDNDEASANNQSRYDVDDDVDGSSNTEDSDELQGEVILSNGIQVMLQQQHSTTSNSRLHKQQRHSKRQQRRGSLFPYTGGQSRYSLLDSNEKERESLQQYQRRHKFHPSTIIQHEQHFYSASRTDDVTSSIEKIEKRPDNASRRRIPGSVDSKTASTKDLIKYVQQKPQPQPQQIVGYHHRQQVSVSGNLQLQQQQRQLTTNAHNCLTEIDNDIDMITQLVKASRIIDQDDTAVQALIQLKNGIERTNQYQLLQERKADESVQRTISSIQKQHEQITEQCHADFINFITSIQKKADNLIEQQQQRLAQVEEQQQAEVERQRQEQQHQQDEEDEKQRVLEQQKKKAEEEKQQQESEREGTTNETVSTPERTKSSASTATPTSSSSMDYIAKSKKVAEQLQKMQKSIEIFESSKVVSKRRLLYKKTVTGKVNTLVENVAKIQEVANEVSQVITSARNDDDAAKQQSNSPPETKIGRRYLIDLLCSKVIVRVQAEGFNGYVVFINIKDLTF